MLQPLAASIDLSSFLSVVATMGTVIDDPLTVLSATVAGKEG